MNNICNNHKRQISDRKNILIPCHFMAQSIFHFRSTFIKEATLCLPRNINICLLCNENLQKGVFHLIWIVFFLVKNLWSLESCLGFVCWFERVFWHECKYYAKMLMNWWSCQVFFIKNSSPIFIWESKTSSINSRMKN